MISDARTGQALTTISTIPSSGLAVDWGRRRIVMSTMPGTAGDAVWYDLQRANPEPQVISRVSRLQRVRSRRL